MITEMKRRKYTMRRRAERQRETRERIVRATVALHEEIGPRATTIQAIADRAGVERLTVYRHFPDEVTLFAACSGHFMADHPPPDPETWSQIEDPVERARRALAAFYAYYRTVERMFASVLRDAETLPAMKAITDRFEELLDSIRDDLASGFRLRGGRRKRLAAALGHGLRFRTWQSLAAEGLSDSESARMIGECARSLASR
ncbi:MAG: TetR family transcriptional regulator [Candidatus Eisenbacteria bacterium]|nr:TetR family transcriptional regulator [Candidatus Latescibacterota bacterium]MBD3302539.1 TetR family transcriptional regulator [Candidatus Eisenbacteria bacterium]